MASGSSAEYPGWKNLTHLIHFVSKWYLCLWENMSNHISRAEREAFVSSWHAFGTLRISPNISFELSSNYSSLSSNTPPELDAISPGNSCSFTHIFCRIYTLHGWSTFSPLCDFSLFVLEKGVRCTGWAFDVELPRIWTYDKLTVENVIEFDIKFSLIFWPV